MTTRVQQWGNSLGVRIPKSLAREVSVRRGSEMKVGVANGRIVLSPVRKKAYRLADLVERITPENVHEEIQTGSPKGREIW